MDLGQFVPPSMRLFLSTLSHSAWHSANNPSSSHDNHGQYNFITWNVVGCPSRDKPPPNACHVSLWTEAWSIQISSPCEACNFSTMDKRNTISQEKTGQFRSPHDEQGLQCQQHRCRSGHSKCQLHCPNLALLWSPSWLCKWSLTLHRPLARSLSAPSHPDLWPWRHVAGLKHQGYGNTWQKREMLNNHSKLQLLHFALQEEDATKEKQRKFFLDWKL